MEPFCWLDANETAIVLLMTLPVVLVAVIFESIIFSFSL